MVEVGKIYMLNASWHPKNCYHALIVHSRVGVSDAYKNQTIFHVILSDFASDIDWDTEYIEDNFIDSAIYMPDYFSFVKQCRPSKHMLVSDEYVYHCNSKLYEQKDKLSRDDTSLGFLSFLEIYNLRKYYDDSYNFIPLDPPN